MKKYKFEVLDKRDKTIVYQHQTNNYETLKKWVAKYFKECEKYPFYRYETYIKTYEDGVQFYF
jgi:hypothetical protein